MQIYLQVKFLFHFLFLEQKKNKIMTRSLHFAPLSSHKTTENYLVVCPKLTLLP